jgi:hypothetical protein
MEFSLIRDSRVGALHGKGRGYFKRALRWMRQATRDGFDALVLLIDEDGDPDRIGQIAEAQEHWSMSDIPRALGVAIRTFDAWFLADEQAITAVLGGPVQRQPDPEREQTPKDRCRSLVDNAGSGVALRDLYRELSEQIDLTKLEARCPRGFAPFAARVRDLPATECS